MSKVKELEELLKEDILVELTQNIKEAQIELDKKPSSKDAKEDLKYNKEIQAYFNDVIVDIDNNILKEEDEQEMLEVLEEMKIENQI